MEPEGSSLHAQEHATCPCSEPDQSSPCPSILLLEDPPTYAWVFQVGSFPQVSPTKPCMHLCPSTSTRPHTCCMSHLILLQLITRMLSGEKYRSLRSSLRSFLHTLVNWSFLVPNILISTLFSYTLSLCSSLNVSDYFYTHTTQNSKLRVTLNSLLNLATCLTQYVHLEANQQYSNFFMFREPLVGQGLLIIKVSKPHSDTPHIR